jgi:hypothetical protein
MSIISPTSHTPLTNDSEIWSSLKQAIAASSGFQRWEIQLSADEKKTLSTDARVQRYLRETLETLAY